MIKGTLGESDVVRSIFSWQFFQMVIKKCMNSASLIKIKAYKDK